MAKKLVYNYTFTPGLSGVGTLEFEGNYPLKTVQLITNVTDNIIIYNFADITKGGTTSYNSDTNITTLTFDHNTSSMSSDDQLQIFIDIVEDKIDFSETFVDPVSKLRVSEPQNLIDTDFEYGLQPTKWETVELVNNIPSFYSNSADYSIADIISVDTITGSENVTVTTAEAHGLVVGSPIDIQGLSSRTAEGKFLVSKVVSTTSFVYKAKASQAATGTINGSYTVIIPGQFYDAADISIDDQYGIETDAGTPSSLKVTTEYTHGFIPGSSLYFTNTIGSEIFTLSQTTSSAAPDGRPYVDYDNTISTTLSPTINLTETKQMTGTYARKFVSSDVNTSTNAISWPNHGLQAGDVLLYIPPSGDTAVGGLERFQIYYVKSAGADTITLCQTTNGNYSSNATIPLTSQGTSNYGRHQLILGYEVYQAQKDSNNYISIFYTRNFSTGVGSGWDLSTYSFDSAANRGGYFGKGTTYPSRIIHVQKTGTSSYPTGIVGYGGLYSTRDDANFTFGKAGNTPDGYDFIEDYNRFDGSNYPNSYFNNYYNFANPEFRNLQQYFINLFDYGPSYNSFPTPGTTFYFFLKADSEADSLFIPSHGLDSGTSGTITITSGSAISYRTDSNQFFNTIPQNSNLTSGSNISITRLNADRIRISPANRITSAVGAYNITASLPSPTKNSFYLAGNSFVNNQQIYFSAGAGGALPSTTTGATSPVSDTITTVYNSVKTSLDSIKTTMGADSGKLLYDGFGDHYPFGSSNQFFDSGRQYFYYFRYQAFSDRYDINGGYSGGTGANLDNRSGWANGVAWDPFEATNIGGLGFKMITTPYQQNQTTNYWIEIAQIPNLSNLSLSRASFNIYDGGYFYSQFGSTSSINNIYTNWTSLGSGWRYTYQASYINQNSTYHGMISMHMIIDNSGWPGYYEFWYDTIFAYNNQPNVTHYGAGGTRYQIKVFIPIKAGSTVGNYGVSGSVLTFNQIANTIASNISSTLTNPSLQVGINTVFINLINNNRFSIKNGSGVEYDLTSSGTASLDFATDEVTGALDGYYNVDSATDTTITSFLTSSVPARVVDIPYTGVVGIGGITYIYYDKTHKLKTKQKIRYSVVSNPSLHGIPGLTHNTDYYTIAVGPNHIKLASSLINAAAGNAISIATTSVGTFKLTVPSISGISSAPGTVGLTSNKTAVTGSGTLFKRFYKTGDNLNINDMSTNPPTYRTFKIDSVIDDLQLTLNQTPGIGTANANYFIDTKIYTRPDGAFLHRPFDGGVEINAGTSPNSSIVRQTRKYFRYQSGKGIQCSLAINFNPSRIATTLVSSASTSLPKQTYTINVNNNGSVSYNLAGKHRDGSILGQNPIVKIAQGDVVNFVVNSGGNILWVKTAPTTGTGNAVVSGITNNGTAQGTITWDTAGISTGTYYYQGQTSQSMTGLIQLESAGITTTIATVGTKYPHGLTRTNTVKIKGSSDSSYNGTFQVRASDDFNFSYYLPSEPASSVPDGIIEYNIDSWANSAIRCGLMDYQNGMFFEFDGSTLYCVRRSSVQQLPGTARVQNDSNIVNGVDTNFSGQLTVGGYVVIRGMSYRITKLESKTVMHIQPAYRGIDASDVIITKTVDTKVPQTQWNIDKADGTGPSGFVLDLTKIQMAYIDYSWYGAGKIRFGFKDTYGHVKYMHEFYHNNRLEEAYMRSGNIPGRYEIENTGTPTYVPSLFHWGTSVIMDGKFDDDKAYLFTASSNNLSFTNGDSKVAITTSDSFLNYQYNYSLRQFDWYVQVPFSTIDASKFGTGQLLYTQSQSLNGTPISYTDYNSGYFNVYLYQSSSRFYSPPAVYPHLPSGTRVSIGAPETGSAAVDLTSEVPLISISLAPSVDNNLTGNIGAREIINRMQLQLKSLGITVSHDCNVDLILNGAISNRNFVDASSPSLSQLVRHTSGEQVIGGNIIFSLRASGGSKDPSGKRISATSDFDLSQITDLGNAILGGDGAFPNGPDLLTIAIKPVDTSDINATTPLTVASRITWTESQA